MNQRTHQRNNRMGDLPRDRESQDREIVGPESGSIALRKMQKEIARKPPPFNNMVFINSGRTIGVTSKQVLQDNPGRQYILVQNNSGGNIFIGFGTKADTINGVKIVPGGNYEPYLAPRSSIHVIASGANSNVVVVEGYGSK